MISLLRITAENQPRYLERIIEIETLSFPAPWSVGGFTQEIRNPIARLWAAMVNGQPAGFILYWVLDFEVNLLNLAVHPDERGKGVGRFLLNHMVEEAVTREVETLWLEVRVSNESAIRLYRKLGFEKVGVRRKYYDDTQEDAIVMCLPLSESAGSTPHSPLSPKHGGEGEGEGARRANTISRR
jgi:ribosomal-protein-alanine N-acetyltransferase